MDASVLILEDEREIADLVGLYLKNEGFDVHSFALGAQVLAFVNDTPPDLAILDVMLPDMDGFEVCRRIRQTHHFPIIMLTARVEDMDKITGLTIGADDYITKPFNPLELVARVKAQLRRYTRYNDNGNGKEAQEDELDVRALSINRITHKCSLNGMALALTPIEFDILWHLIKNKGRVVSSEELFEAVWGERFLDNNNTVMAHIGRLREKLGEPPRHPRFIKTVWGVGYQIE